MRPHASLCESRGPCAAKEPSLRALDTKKRRVRTGIAKDGTLGAIDQPEKTMRRRAERISCEPRYPSAFNAQRSQHHSDQPRES
jgi:hypothetical protein